MPMKKILIAETNAVTKAILEIAFTDLQGFEGEVIFADTPDEAINLIKIHSPDMFLISDGEEFNDIETLYQNARKTASNIPFVILYTSGKNLDYTESNNPEIINILLKKPFSVIKLLGIIKGLSDGRINESELIEEPFDKEEFIKEAIRTGRLEVPEILRDKEGYVELIPPDLYPPKPKEEEKEDIFKVASLDFEENSVNNEIKQEEDSFLQNNTNNIFEVEEKPNIFSSFMNEDDNNTPVEEEKPNIFSSFMNEDDNNIPEVEEKPNIFSSFMNED